MHFYFLGVNKKKEKLSSEVALLHLVQVSILLRGDDFVQEFANECPRQSLQRAYSEGY